jgi:hypothetical protein
MTKYDDIIERLRKSEGPDRTIDGLIDVIERGGHEYVIGHEEGRFPQKAIYGTIADVMKMLPNEDGAAYINSPPFTASIDASIALAERMMPGEWIDIGGTTGSAQWECNIHTDYVEVQETAPTAPLAILLSLFLALQAKD